MYCGVTHGTVPVVTRCEHSNQTRRSDESFMLESVQGVFYDVNANFLRNVDRKSPSTNFLRILFCKDRRRTQWFKSGKQDIDRSITLAEKQNKSF